MKDINKLSLTLITTLVLLLFSAGLVNPPLAQGQPNSIEEGIQEMLGLDELAEGYFTLLSDEGLRLLRTARVIRVGNQYHTLDNKLYEVHTVEGHTAWARFVKDIPLGAKPTAYPPGIATRWDAQPVQQQEERKIAIYHTHGDESYVPSDGSESIDEGGGIIQVGAAFAEALEEMGVKAIQSEETHYPHDAGAYNRSRRTAVELLGEKPDAIFDVHRDAVPPEEYEAQVDGEQITQVQLVVGQQNQNMGTIQQYAEELKRIGDEKYPNLIKGIFYASGDYNQDLSPHSLLIEVGTHENPREQAEEAMTFFADVTTTYLYGEGVAAQSGRDRTTKSASKGILWLLGALVLVGGIYLYIATGSWEGAGKKLRQFISTEFRDVLGQRPRQPAGNEPPPDDIEEEK
ncbi:MAG: stage II sporulation protein P [Firmicutes bacterium]|nr:stage II sporulation protein P [Bacillota bacterium]